MFIKFLYNIIIIPILYFAVLLASIFSKKLSSNLKARKKIFKELESNKIRLNPYKKTILFHCSSFGEFKQVIPIINKFSQGDNENKYNIILSLFSSSAYENLDTIPGVDIITYTPLDFYHQTNKFINICRPDLVLISKHDVWPNFIFSLNERKIPVYLVNALFASDSKMAHWYAKPFFKALFKRLTGVITIDESNKKRFQSLDIDTNKLFESGDSRYDTVVLETKIFQEESELIKRLKISEKIFVAGSSWPDGERIIINSWQKIKEQFNDAFLIIVPHEINIEHIYKIETYCQEHSLSHVVFSELTDETELEKYDVLIIDSIGKLSEIYGAASIAYVGGGFGKSGLHSVLEPAAYNIPVLFGSNLEKSPEATEMEREHCGFIFKDEDEFYNHIKRIWSNKYFYTDIANSSKHFVDSKIGATNKIMDIVSKEIAKKNEVNVMASFTEDEIKEFNKIIDE